MAITDVNFFEMSYFLTLVFHGLGKMKTIDLMKVYEAMLFWRGAMNAGEFADAVGLTRQRVQENIVSPFVKDRAGDLLQERGPKHGRTLLVRPKSAPADLWSFFGLLAAERAWRRTERPGLSSLAGLDVIDLAPPDPAGTAAWMCRAAAQKRVVVGRYLFKRHGVLAVRFSPHAMVRTPRRIHFRGHLLVQTSGETQDWGYVDLVPGRLQDDGDILIEEGRLQGREGRQGLA